MAYYAYMIKNFQGSVFQLGCLYNEDSWTLEEVLKEKPRDAIALNKVSIYGTFLENVKKF